MPESDPHKPKSDLEHYSDELDRLLFDRAVNALPPKEQEALKQKREELKLAQAASRILLDAASKTLNDDKELPPKDVIEIISNSPFINREILPPLADRLIEVGQALKQAGEATHKILEPANDIVVTKMVAAARVRTMVTKAVAKALGLAQTSEDEPSKTTEPLQGFSPEDQNVLYGAYEALFNESFNKQLGQYAPKPKSLPQIADQRVNEQVRRPEPYIPGESLMGRFFRLSGGG